MPVELSERELRDAIAVVGEWNRKGAQAAKSAFEWMGWEGEEPLCLRRYDVQLFVWYVLPRKYLVGLDDKEAVAAALAKTLERLGGQAASYAEVCRAPETQRLLRAWEAEDPAAPRTFRKLLDDPGIEPPDTDQLAWGSVMGFEEARVREQVATALEEAIESGSLAPGASGVREALTGFISMKGKLDLEVTRVLEVDDLALVIGVWSFDGTGPDGTPVQLAAKNADVLRRQADGTWRFVIDNPWGTD